MYFYLDWNFINGEEKLKKKKYEKDKKEEDV